MTSLLLLPQAPAPMNPASLRAAYAPAIKTALTVVNSSRTTNPSILEIALSCPQIHNRLQLPRSQLFQELSSVLAGLYSLSCVIAAECGIATDGPGGVDVRVVLVSYKASESFENGVSLASLGRVTCGPIVDLPNFALTRRNWQYIFHLDGEEGVRIYSDYMGLATRMSPAVKGERRIVSGGISMVSRAGMAEAVPERTVQVHSVVAVGGTFDHLHPGHKLLLSATALLLQPALRVNDPPRRLIIGITGDQLLVNKKYAEYMQSWKERQDDVVDFLFAILSGSRSGSDEVHVQTFNEPVVNGKAIHTTLKRANIVIECVEIQDPFGPTITDESITALVVSAETRSGGAAVNDKRKEKSWHPLEVFEVDVLDAQIDDSKATETQNFASKISSSAIRQRKAESANQSLL